GTREIVATPHVNERYYIAPFDIPAAVAALNASLVQEPESVSGAEMVGGADNFAAQAARICRQAVRPDHVSVLLGGNDDDPRPIATRTADGSTSTEAAAPGEAVTTEPAGDSMVSSQPTSAGTPAAAQRLSSAGGAVAPSQGDPAARPAVTTPAPARQNPAAAAANSPTFVRRTAPAPSTTALAAPPAPARASGGSIPAPSGAEFRENLSHRCQSLASASEASACLQRDMAAADSELNSVYRNVMSQLDPQRREALRESQRAWLLRYDRVITSYYSTSWGNHSRVEVLPSQIQALRDRTAYLRSIADGG
ncbi:MAG: DUF1311 domain-containing protein, partial [Gemmatimonadetes bacterium]|nr:DUF1311 domain-containing protein [Gemmatimonadota bacterium]